MNHLPYKKLEISEAMNWCVIIPTYNNGKTLGKVLGETLQITPNIIVVNDGSTDQTKNILDRYPAVTCISYDVNKGKGYALRKGFERAINDGFDYAITLDSDGQHFASDLPVFLKKAEAEPDSLIVGSRTLEGEKLRQGSGFANKFSNFWFRIISGVTLPDTQSGFRLYPLKPLKNLRFYSDRYEFELEILYRAAWKGIKLLNVPVNVFYPERKERISHFRPFRDFCRIGMLNALCFFVAFFYIKPFLCYKSLKKESIKDFIRKNVLHTSDSAEKMTFSVMLGIFMGIIPIWGYQLITAIALAYILKLNKLLVIVAANISIFPFTAVILYLSYVTGGLVLSADDQVSFSLELSLARFGNNLFQYFIGAIVLAVAASLFFGLLTFVYFKLVRRKSAIVN